MEYDFDNHAMDWCDFAERANLDPETGRPLTRGGYSQSIISDIWRDGSLSVRIALAAGLFACIVGLNAIFVTIGVMLFYYVF